MKVTSKGQITLPKAIRDRHGITPRTELEFVERRGQILLVKKHSASAASRIRGRVERLPVGRDVDEYLRLARRPSRPYFRKGVLKSRDARTEELAPGAAR